MAATVFPDITFWQDTPANRAIAVGYTGVGTPEKRWQSINPPNDSGTTPGILYADTPASARNIAAGSKILMRVASLAVDSDTRSYPTVKNWRVGNTNTQTALTKTAAGNNQLCLIAATNPSVDVDTLIVPTPAAIGFQIRKLNFSQAVPPASTQIGAFSQYWDPFLGVYTPLTPVIEFSPDGYNTYWEWASNTPGNPYDDGGPLITGLPLPTFIWFELTPTSSMVANTRYRLVCSDTLEFHNLSSGEYNPPF